jgi:diguanylate cyclase (GGDEF)-like protein/PAS domain S-box-containing protein
MTSGISQAQHSGDAGALSRAEEAAILAEQRLREAIEVLPEGIVFLDAEGRYILWNRQYAEIYAASADLLRPGARLADTLRIGVERGDYPESEGREEEWLTERLSLLQNPGVRHEQRLANGRVIMIEERKTAGDGTIGIRVDITELKQREESFRLLFEGNPVPLLVYEPASGRIRSANDAACAHFGYTVEDIEGLSAATLFEDDEWTEAGDMLATDHSEKDRFWRQRTRDGARLESVLFTRRTILGDGEPATIVSVFDVTERRRIEARMAHMARHDELTGFTNRSHCREVLHDLLAAPPEDESVTIALVDLDHFKAVNDTHGHHVGDALLAEAARRMSALVQSAALLSRIGGDEFAVIFRNASSDQVETMARAIIATLSEPFTVGDHVLHIGATVGTASAPRDSSDAESLLRYADLALYAAKGRKRGTVCRFHRAMDVAAQQKARLESDFREAVQTGALQVFYQPLIHLESGAVEGYEALLRWMHPVRGQVSPEIFVPLAEEMGLIEQVGQFVLNTACREACNWPEHVKLAVNVSPLQFRNGNLLHAVVQALAGSGLTPERLELEITEAVLMDKGPRTLAIIRELRSFGIGLSMDDFGTGYSSLRYLLSYPFTKIKIDKSFVLNLEQTSDSQAVIRAVIGLGRSLGMTVTAEGIEREDVREYLKAEGCEQGQGYLFGEARPATELEPGMHRAAA